MEATIAIRIDSDLAERFKKVAKETDRTMSQILRSRVREIIEQAEATNGK